MTTIFELLSFENPVFRTYIYYGSILALKILFIVVLTGRCRYKKKAFATIEDVNMFNKLKIPPLVGSEVKFDDPDIERCRRAHLNDLENIVVYLFVAFFYVLSDPKPTVAINLFRAFTAARFLHTIVYAIVIIPQPARFLCFSLGYAITIYMAIFTIIVYH